jgi:hypothetical protein
MKRSTTTERKNKQKRLFFFTLLVKKDEHTLQSAMEQVRDLITGSESGVEPTKVLIEDFPSRDQLQNGRRKFKEERCKELIWLTFNRTTGIAVCDQCAHLPTIADRNSNRVKGFAGPFKLRLLRKITNRLNIKNR